MAPSLSEGAILSSVSWSENRQAGHRAGRGVPGPRAIAVESAEPLAALYLHKRILRLRIVRETGLEADQPGQDQINLPR